MNRLTTMEAFIRVIDTGVPSGRRASVAGRQASAKAKSFTSFIEMAAYARSDPFDPKHHGDLGHSTTE